MPIKGRTDRLSCNVNTKYKVDSPFDQDFETAPAWNWGTIQLDLTVKQTRFESDICLVFCARN